MIITCPHCNIPMKSGIALKESCPVNTICECLTVYNWGNLEIIDCLKCPNCGHSDNMKGN